MAHHRHRPMLRRAPALAIAALLALVVPAALAQAARSDATDAALATERYLSSYGPPEPLTAPTTTAPRG